MHDCFVVDASTERLLQHATILVDACTIIDTWNFKNEFADLLAKLTELDCYLVTTKAVVIEFLGGTKDDATLRTKIEYLETIFGKTVDNLFLPLSQNFPSNDEFLEFSRQVNKFGTTDFELYRALKRYSRSGLLLMTRNHKDFTIPTFRRRGFITLLGKKEVQTHGLYSL